LPSCCSAEIFDRNPRFVIFADKLARRNGSPRSCRNSPLPFLMAAWRATFPNAEHRKNPK